MAPLRIPVGRPVTEALAAALLLGGAGLIGVRAARAYDLYVRPAARTLPSATPTPVIDPAQRRESARRQRLASDHVGAGIALRATRPRAAIEEFLLALSIDPSNPEARQNLVEMGATLPVPAATPTPSPPSPVPSVTPRGDR